MRELLRRDDKLSYWVADALRGDMLAPMVKNLLYKVENGWDDYDEVYHFCRLAEAVRTSADMQMDFHTAEGDGHVVGVCAVTHGRLDPAVFFRMKFHPEEAGGTYLVLNGFHVEPESRGIGRQWLEHIVLPHYRGKGYTALYVKSSHPKAFTLYERLGTRVGEYIANSDNGHYERQGKIFRIGID